MGIHELTLRRQPGMAIDLEKWPIQALSAVDCFHPSEAAHRRVAAGFWNRLTLERVSESLGLCGSDLAGEEGQSNSLGE